jgi:hypothetical protein
MYQWIVLVNYTLNKARRNYTPSRAARHPRTSNSPTANRTWVGLVIRGFNELEGLIVFFPLVFTGIGTGEETPWSRPSSPCIPSQQGRRVDRVVYCAC